ncbi:putative zinc-binding peptidase [Nguyenibacter vanlangensis]|uniref:Zinc-binding peptidase n=1 Tax=Nguyenibacter vanlangensis TaxID=1216886 RepID=A0ABZ3DBF9_9PROT
MKLFVCQACDQVLFFENTVCERCGHTLGYLPEENDLSALEPVATGEDDKGGVWRPLSVRAAEGATYRFCANAAHGVCNWLVPEGGEAFCLACRHNRVIPDLAIPGNAERWQRLETAKHRLIYTLLRLGLPIRTRQDDPRDGLAFDFLEDAADGTRAMTGHQDGVVTIAVREADDAARETMRVAMGEPYRTLLGHFRHEVGHYYWNLLVRDGGGDESGDRDEGALAACRAIFGDDRADYRAALQHHYQSGPPPGWQDHYVSDYATTHAWEDFAETWAHYLHIVATLETARAYGLSVGAQAPGNPAPQASPAPQADIDFDPYDVESFEPVARAWMPLTYAINSLNRSMGQADFYPFVLAPPVLEKLAFIHDLVRRARNSVYC